MEQPKLVLIVGCIGLGLNIISASFLHGQCYDSNLRHLTTNLCHLSRTRSLPRWGVGDTREHGRWNSGGEDIPPSVFTIHIKARLGTCLARQPPAQRSTTVSKGVRFGHAWCSDTCRGRCCQQCWCHHLRSGDLAYYIPSSLLRRSCCQHGYCNSNSYHIASARFVSQMSDPRPVTESCTI